MRKHLTEAWKLASGAPLRVKVALFLLAVYLLSPIDLIPDFIPVIGQLDDLILIGLVGAYVVRHVPEFARYLPKKNS